MGVQQFREVRGTVEIDGQTRLVGVLGWPVEHSLSPRMHQAAFKALELNWAYLPLPVAPERLRDAVRGLAAMGFVGANVTVPHKSEILHCLDELSPIARAIGAVNTLVTRPDGTIWGDNTDAYGFMTDLAGLGWPGGSSSGRKALVIGAGGAARAVVFGLVASGARVAVVNRSYERAIELCTSIGGAAAVADPAARARLSAHRFPDDLAMLARDADLIVNATRLGLHGNDDPLPWNPAVPLRRDQAVYDLVYRRTGQTPFLALAEASGCPTRDGLGMLIHQGAGSFERWTGAKAPVEVMRQALERERREAEDMEREMST